MLSATIYIIYIKWVDARKEENNLVALNSITSNPGDKNILSRGFLNFFLQNIPIVLS